MEKTCNMCGRTSDDKYGDFCCYCGTPFPKAGSKVHHSQAGNYGNQGSHPQAGNYVNQGYNSQAGNHTNQSYNPQIGNHMNQGYSSQTGNHVNQDYQSRMRNYGNRVFYSQQGNSMNQGYPPQAGGYGGQVYNQPIQNQYGNPYQAEMPMKWYKWCLYAVIPLNIITSSGVANWADEFSSIFGVGDSIMERYREEVSAEFAPIKVRSSLSMIVFSIINIQYFRKETICL